MPQIKAYIGARLAEHSTQMALAADLATIGALIQDKITLSTAVTAIASSLVAIVFPSSSAK